MDFVTVRNPRIPFIIDMHLHIHTHIFLHVYVDMFFIGLFTANKTIETNSTNKNPRQVGYLQTLGT